MSWLRQRVNFIVFSTVYGEEREIITRYVFLLKSGKIPQSSENLGAVQAEKRRFERTIAEEGGVGGWNKEEKLHDRRRLLIGQYESNSLRVKESVSIRQRFFSLYAHRASLFGSRLPFAANPS